MSKRKLSNWLQTYLQYSGYSEAPEQFHFWTGVSTLGGALRRRVWIDMGYFQWTPNFYVVLVAPPGIVSKSTTISIGMKLLRQLDDVVFGPDAVTWQALTESLAESTREVDIDNTFHPMSCITIASSEFGTFMNPQDREMVDVMVSLWDGQLGTWEKRTKTQGSDQIVNPWINMIACTTPAWIAGNFPEYMIGGGFTSRCVFVYGEEKRQLVAYPGKQLPADFKTMESNLVHDLEIISELKGQVELDKEALAYGEQWYEKHYELIKEGRFDQAKFGGYMARKQTHIHKLAIVIAAAQRDELVIKKEDLHLANQITSGLEADMPKVFSMIGRSGYAQLTDSVYRVVQQHKAIDKPLLFKELRASYGATEIEEGLRGCMLANLISQVQKEGRIILVDEEYRLSLLQGESSSTGSEPGKASATSLKIP